MKNLKIVLFIAGLTPLLGQAQEEQVQLGAHIDRFKIECSGTLIVKSVNKVSVSNGFSDRAGNYHPPKGFAYLNLEVQSTTPGCETMKQTLGVDIKSKPFEDSMIMNTTDLAELKLEAEKHVGKVVPFETSQYFEFADKNGNLPFFPLLHTEKVILKASDSYYLQKNFEAKNPAAKGYLYNSDKVQVTEAIFAYLKEHSLSHELSDNLILALLKNSPDWEKDFKVFLDQVLVIYTNLENHAELPTETGFHFDFKLSIIADGLAKLTNEYPKYYQFKLPNLLANHPSMLVKTGTVPNVSTADVENAIDLIEANLAAGAYSDTVKFYLQEPLKHISGGIIGSSYLSKLSSKYAKEKANSLLKQYYPKN